MKHEWIEDVGVNISQFDDVVKVDICKFCDCQMWTWLQVKNREVKPQKYMLLHGTQYWNPDEECPDTYKLQQVFKPVQQTLF